MLGIGFNRTKIKVIVSMFDWNAEDEYRVEKLKEIMQWTVLTIEILPYMLHIRISLCISSQ